MGRPAIDPTRRFRDRGQAFLTPGRRLGLILWAAGMAGVASITLTLVPGLAEDAGAPAPLWLISLASIAQSGALLALAVWAGVRLAPRVGLGAPALAALAAGARFGPALRGQVGPGLLGGAIGGLLLQVAWLLEPDGIPAAAAAEVPRLVRVLYGGITEELLTRWGLMTVLLWGLWSLLQRRRGPPRAGLAWAAIVLSAIPFGVGHLPLVAATADGLSAGIVVWVVGANALFGLLAGFLYWRFGLESAIAAHALAHGFDYLAALAAAL